MGEPVLDIRGISKTFGALKASDNVSLDLKPGEIHALIGPNGAGKSTLIKQIAGELTPDEGSIHLAGRDVTGLDAVARARAGLARSYQVSSVAGEFTVLQNVMLAVQGRLRRTYRFFLPALSDKRLVEPAMAALERVDLAYRADMRASDISHGERRALEMTIAMAQEPKVFLLDEPMAGMGPDGSKQMTELLDELRKEAPILLVEHDMEAVFALADRISVLVYGQIIASGTVDEVRNDPVVRAAYLGEEEA
ncbi:ABC transporter ATP-binding protein [Breoghania sp.]|uniref:ABC transporter ATP-binding protein n=1 Tax=Breoghania sp. TaxID=2065378 RepID=UPI002AA7A3DB|nr:ABC transporter ATP-binding protein [Breoghania sp.]